MIRSMSIEFNGMTHVLPKEGNSHSVVCGNCGNNVGAIRVARHSRDDGQTTYWLICPLCSYGIVLEVDGKVLPTSKYGETLLGLSDKVGSAYNEARDCFSINAYNGCQLVCRTILMHIAVDKCGGKEGDTFANYIDNITKAGYITPPMKSWVDVIRKEGNDATHKLASPSKEDAENIMNFTTQLLRLVYEMDHKATQFTKKPSS